MVTLYLKNIRKPAIYDSIGSTNSHQKRHALIKDTMGYNSYQNNIIITSLLDEAVHSNICHHFNPDKNGRII